MTTLLIKHDEIGYISKHDDQSYGMFCPVARIYDNDFAGPMVSAFNQALAAKVAPAPAKVSDENINDIAIDYCDLAADGNDIDYIFDFKGLMDFARALLAQGAPVQADKVQQECDARDASYLQSRDLVALQRFFECCDDPDSGGHDVPKDAMARLREIGVVAHKNFGRHEITSFGDFVLGHTIGADLKLPLKTYAEYCEESRLRSGYSDAGDAAIASTNPDTKEKT